MKGRLYDGVTAHPHVVDVEFGAAELKMTQPGGWTAVVAGDELRRADSPPGAIKLGRNGQPGWRLMLPLEAEPELAPMLGKEERYGRWIDRVGLLPAAIIGALVTGSLVTVGYLAPHWLAPHIPMSWERNVGSAIVGDFGELRCRSAKGQRALEMLVERVAPGSTTGPQGIRVAALNVPMFNAAALPGGYIVVFKPAIAETEPDALAGIIAHEVAHVRRRHVTEALLRELGIGALIRMFAGNIGANAEQIVALSYTRENESEADADAIRMLKQAAISPEPTAKLFQSLEKEVPSYSAEFLQSHPLSGKRARRFHENYSATARYRPALNRDQADALLDICRTASKSS